MLRKSLCARLMACAAGAALLLPALPVSAAPQAAQQVRQRTDVVLSGGNLTGQLLDANGKAIEGAVVVLSKDGKVIGRTVTKADGSYNLSGLKAGAYNLSIGKSQVQVRLWNKESAPVAAKSQLNASEVVVRGQDGSIDGTTLVVGGLGIAGLTGGIIALNQDDDDNNKPNSP